MKELVRDNPMSAEAIRVNRQMLTASTWTATHTGTAVLAGSFYLLLLALIIRHGMSVPPVVFTILMLATLTLSLPLSLHGVIAGEREKRSLEMLLAAPVTSRQIVAAKLLRVVGLAAATVGLIGLPGLVIAVIQVVSGAGEPPLPTLFWGNALLQFAMGLGMVFSFSFAASSFSLLVSSRAKTAGASLLACVGGFLGALVVVPYFLLLVGGLSSEFRSAAGFLAQFHPFFAVAGVPLASSGSPFFLFGREVGANLSPHAASAVLVLVQIIAMAVWVGLGTWMLNLAAKALDQERKG
jgi:ABC-type transport system involved in multi-copper enzyme maturation permease subunit